LNDNESLSHIEALDISPALIDDTEETNNDEVDDQEEEDEDEGEGEDEIDDPEEKNGHNQKGTFVICVYLVMVRVF
jgi:hypothetical protein